MVFGDLRWLDFWGLSMIGILIIGDSWLCAGWSWLGVGLLKIVGCVMVEDGCVPMLLLEGRADSEAGFVGLLGA